tara:strand:- start:721 stop:1236 length:516 start_codon:yes stop_codon:yes gene_type:complete
MAYFAKLDDNNIVLEVVAVKNEVIEDSEGNEQESLGITFLRNLYNDQSISWVQTSFNTLKKQHLEGGTAFRGNFASKNYVWDSINEIFWQPQPFTSWLKDNATASWVAPIKYPSIEDDGADPSIWYWEINWNETAYQSDNTKGWEGTKINLDRSDNSDTKTYDWNGTSWVA